MHDIIYIYILLLFTSFEFALFDKMSPAFFLHLPPDNNHY